MGAGGRIWGDLEGSRGWDGEEAPRSEARGGVHRQILLASLGCFVGYQLVKRSEYVHAKVDRELLEYIRQHPVDFHAGEGKKRIGQLLEDFHPIQ
uniref:NADH dehydrogenase [ubiquinone] 1 subunit C2 n=1 Tax=Ficedula albicollis TaxID=59894 RepID=U3KKT3_FICAL